MGESATRANAPKGVSPTAITPLEIFSRHVAINHDAVYLEQQLERGDADSGFSFLGNEYVSCFKCSSVKVFSAHSEWRDELSC